MHLAAGWPYSNASPPLDLRIIADSLLRWLPLTTIEQLWQGEERAGAGELVD